MYSNLELMGIYWHSVLARRYGSVSKKSDLITEKVLGYTRDIRENDILRLPIKSLSGNPIPVEAEMREFLAKNYFKFRCSSENFPKLYGVAVIYDSFLGRFFLKVDGRLLTSLEGINCWDRIVSEQLRRFSSEAEEMGVGFFRGRPMYMDFVVTPVYCMGTVGGEVGKVYRGDHINVFSDSRKVFERFGVRDPGDDLYVLSGGEFRPVGSREVVYLPREDYYFGGDGWTFYKE